MNWSLWLWIDLSFLHLVLLMVIMCLWSRNDKNYEDPLRKIYTLVSGISPLPEIFVELLPEPFIQRIFVSGAFLHSIVALIISGLVILLVFSREIAHEGKCLIFVSEPPVYFYSRQSRPA